MTSSPVSFSFFRAPALPDMPKVCAFAALALVSLSAAAADAPPVQAVPFPQPPQIDGKLSDPAWQKGVWSQDFVVAEPSLRAAPEGTRFQVGVDSENLYLAARLDRRSGKDLVAAVTDRDGPVWRDDSLEVMLHPIPRIDQYLHFVINSRGVVYDALRVQGGNLADSLPNYSVQVATDVTPDAWTVEMAIPLAELGLTREAGRAWAINVARGSRSGGKPEISTYARLAGELHRPNDFAQLIVEDLDVTPFLWVLANQGENRVVEEEGRLYLETTLAVTNRTDSYVFFDVDLDVVQGADTLGTLAVQRGLDAGATRPFPLRIPVAGKGDAVVDAALRDSRSRKLLARLRFPVKVTHTPMRVVLTAPSYRNAIYTTQKLDAIRGRLEINLPPERLAGGELAVRLQDASGKDLGAIRVPDPSGSAEFALPLPGNLAEGSYLLRAALQTQGAGDPIETELAIHRLGPPPNGGREVRLDENKVTLVDGRPFLPMGAMMVRPRDDLETVAAQGYTAVMEYTFFYWDDATRKAWLDNLHQLGLMAIIYPYAKADMSKGERLRQPMTDEEMAATRELILAWKDHPALLAWYLSDEPELHSTLPERLRQLDRLCRENDPFHPTIILNNTHGGIDTYAEFCDVLMPNPFPGFYRDAGPRRSIEYAYSLVNHAAKALGGSRGVWMTPQAFSWADLRAERANERPPAFEDLRSMIYQGVIAGGTGFIPYSYSHGRRHPSIRLGLGFLAREVDLVRDGILGTRERIEFSAPDDGVLHALRNGTQGKYLFVVNTTNSPREFSAAAPKGGNWRVVSENAAVTLENGRLHDTLPAFATRIYTTNAGIADRLDLARAARLIAEAPTLDPPDAPLPQKERKGLPEFSASAR